MATRRSRPGDDGLLAVATRVVRAHRQTGRRPRDLLAEEFAAHQLSPTSRRRIARAVYRCVQQRRRARFALGEMSRLPDSSRDRAVLLATLVLDGEIEPTAAARQLDAGPRVRIDWEAVATVERRIETIDDPTVRFGVRHSMPDWIAARFLGEVGAEADALATALNSVPPRTIRANLLRVAGRDALADELREAGVRTHPSRLAPHGLVVDGDASLFELEAFQRGAFEQQDEASQLCAEVVAPPPRGRLLDACAGGGGKALALAAALGNRGEILAVDVHDRRLSDLTQRRRRAGVDVIRSLVVPESGWPPEADAFARRADRILLDVPCSGIGSWRRRTDARWTLSPEACGSMRATQGELLDRAVERLAPGARVIYATCTVFGDENEEQVEGALARHPGLELLRVAELLGRERATPITDPTGTFLRLWPHVHDTDGFFAAVLRRRRRK